MTEPPLHETPKRARTRWAAAAIVVVATHVASAALALWHWPHPPDAFEDMGSPMVVELAGLPAAQDSEQASTGDPAAGAPAAPEAEDRQSAQTDADLTAVASPYEAPPELQVAQEQTEKKTETAQEAQPTEAMQQAPPTPSSAPAQEAAPSAPPIIAENALVGSPAEGSAADFSKAEQTWHRAIMAHLGRHKRYPADARAHHVEGETQVAFVLDRGGRVLRSRVTRSSGSALLDQEVLALLTRATPLPSLPPQMRDDQVELNIPIRFRLK
jgi:protein TonB